MLKNSFKQIKFLSIIKILVTYSKLSYKYLNYNQNYYCTRHYNLIDSLVALKYRLINQY